jgi:DNA-binding CsgD family transcriptional regulator
MQSDTTITAGMEEGEAPSEGFARLTPRPDIDRLAVQQALIEARLALDVAIGVTRHALTLAKRLDDALAGTGQTEGSDEPESERLTVPAGRLARREGALSRREQEVLALVAAGYTNKAIARDLIVAPSTVKTHITSLLAKLGVANRVQLAAIATRHHDPDRAASGVPDNHVPLTRSHARRRARASRVSVQTTHLDHPSGGSHHGRHSAEWLDGAVGGTTLRPAVSQNGRHARDAARNRQCDDAVPITAQREERDKAA